MEELILAYIEEVKAAAGNARPLAGLFGGKGGVSNSPCHMEFYHRLKAEVESGEHDAYETVRLLLRADSVYDAPRSARFMLTACQGLAIGLVDQLTPAQRSEFRQYFDEHIPRRKRLQVQDELYKALK